MLKVSKKNLTIATIVSLIICAVVIGLKQPKENAPKEMFGMDSTSFKYVDNFDSGKDPNVIGGVRVTEVSPGAVIKDIYESERCYGGECYSMKLDYSVPKNGHASFITGLNGLDMSAARMLSLQVKKGKGNGEFQLIVEDASGRKSDVDSRKFITPSGEWREMEIPVSVFHQIDMDNLRSIEVRFGNRVKNVAGTIYLDEIKFKGPREIFFNSIRDNIHGFPDRILADSRKKSLFELDDRELLEGIGRDTWRYFENAVDSRHNLPVDFLMLMPQKQIGDYTSPTNIGLYLINIVSAYDLGFISEKEAKNRIFNSLKILKGLAKWHGLFYNFYSTTNLQVAREYISSVDNGWLAVGLVISRSAFGQSIGKQCSELLEGMDFGLLYNETIGHINLGFDINEGYSPYNYGLLVTESRIISFIAIGKGDVPKEHWYKLYRTLPKEWTWQTQAPEGHSERIMGIEVFKGHYVVDGMEIVPSWGGSLFEFLMPALIVDTKNLAPDSFGLNNLRAVKVHMKFAKSKGYPVWGISPSSTPDGSYGGYSEFGVASLGAKGYKDAGIITPYASFLSLDVLPDEAIRNLRNLLDIYEIYGEYGFYDAVNVKTKQVAYKYMALDQGMILPAIDNYLNDGAIKKRFHADPIGKVAIDLLKSEKFFNNN